MGTYLNGGHGNSLGIDRDDGAQQALAQQRRHENGSERGCRRHEHRQSHIAFRNVRAQITRLSSIDGSDQYHARNQCLWQSKRLAQSQGQEWHHAVTECKLHNGRDGLFGDLDKVVGCEGNAHAQHECRQSSGKVFRGKPGKGTGRAQRNASKENGPQGKEIGGNVGRLFVSFKDLLTERLFVRLMHNEYGIEKERCVRRRALL